MPLTISLAEIAASYESKTFKSNKMIAPLDLLIFFSNCNVAIKDPNPAVADAVKAPIMKNGDSFSFASGCTTLVVKSTKFDVSNRVMGYQNVEPNTKL